MTLILSRDFDAGTAGASAAAEFSTTLGTAPTYHAGSAASGALGVLCAGTASASRGTFDFTAVGTLYASVYWNMVSDPGANRYVAEWRGSDGNTKVGDLRVESGRTLRARNAAGVAQGTASPAVPLGIFRLELTIDPNGNVNIRGFFGANRDGATPDWDTTFSTGSTQATCAALILGVITSSTWSIGFDRVRFDDAVMPAAIVTGPAPITGTATSTLPTFTQAASGAVGTPNVTGTAASGLPVFTQASAATYVPPVPTTPAGVSLDPTDTTIVVSWTPSAAATSYTVEWELVATDVTGTAASALPRFGQAATATYTPGPITVAVSSSLPAFAQAAAGDTTVPVFTGAATSSLPGFTQAAAGDYIPESITGTAASALPAFTQQASGSGVVPQFTGAATSSLPGVTQSADGTTAVPVYEATAASVVPGFTQQVAGTATAPQFTGVVESALPIFIQSAEGGFFTYTVIPDGAGLHLRGHATTGLVVAGSANALTTGLEQVLLSAPGLQSIPLATAGLTSPSQE